MAINFNYQYEKLLNAGIDPEGIHIFLIVGQNPGLSLSELVDLNISDYNYHKYRKHISRFYEDNLSLVDYYDHRDNGRVNAIYLSEKGQKLYDEVNQDPSTQAIPAADNLPAIPTIPEGNKMIAHVPIEVDFSQMEKLISSWAAEFLTAPTNNTNT